MSRTENATGLLRGRSGVELLGWILLAQLAGVVGSVATYSNLTTWYAGLAQPPLTPPNWVFAPAWFLLFTLTGVGAWLVSRADAPAGRKRAAYAAFAAQFLLNVGWTWVYFGAESVVGGVVAIVPLWLAVLAAAVTFGRVDRRAGLLLVPYLLWVAFAAYLNYGFWRLNG